MTGADSSLSPKLAQAHKSVQSDEDLSPVEKETVIRFANDQDQAHVYTENVTIMRDLLQYPYFEPNEFRVTDADRFGARIDPEEWPADGAPITGVEGTVPIGCLKLLAGRRAKDWPSQIVSNQKPESEGGESP